MSAQRTYNLPEAAPLTGDEIIEVGQKKARKKSTIGNLVNFIAGSPGASRGIDGGFPGTVYLITQSIEGGNPSSIYLPTQFFDGGNI